MTALRPLSRRRALLALGLPAAAVACGGTPGEPLGPADAATATLGCGPTDGVAVEIVVASGFQPVARPVAPYVRVTIARTLAALGPATYRPGDGVLAAAVRQPATGDFEAAAGGAVRVDAVEADNTVRGALDLRFPSGARVEQAFRARWVAGPPGPRCG